MMTKLGKQIGSMHSIPHVFNHSAGTRVVPTSSNPDPRAHVCGLCADRRSTTRDRAHESSLDPSPQALDEDVTKPKETREVRIRAKVYRVHDVDLVKQTFTVQVQLEASWIEKELKEMAQKAPLLTSSRADCVRILVNKDRTNQYTGKLYCFLPTETDEERRKAKESAKRFWAPRLSFHNIIKVEDEEKWYRFYDKLRDDASNPPIVCFMWKFIGTFSNPMALVSFPLDFQILTMRLVSGYEHMRVKPGTQDNDRRSRTVSESDEVSEHDLLWCCWRDNCFASTKAPVAMVSERAKQVRLVKNQNRHYASNLCTDTFLQEHEYKLYPRLKFVSGETRAENSASDYVYPQLEIQMRVRRYPWNWLFNVVFPLFVLQGSFVTSYAIETGLADRAGVTITLFLAIIAFRYVVTENLPRISYATLIDLYVLSSFILAALIITDQTCQGIGLCEERRINLVNVSGRRLHSHAHSPAEVEVSATLIYVLCLWLSSHGLIALAILARAIYFYQDEERWLLPEKSLWIGSLCKEHVVVTDNGVDDGGVPQVHLSEEATPKLHGFLARALELPQGWTPEKLLERCQIYAWTPTTASTFGKTVHGQQYLGNKPFVVATFRSHHDARKVFSYAANLPDDDPNLKDEVSDFFTHKCIKVEDLDEKYAWLLERGTLSRSLSRQVSKKMLEAVRQGKEQSSLH